jgi:hypothetical protein
MTPLGHGLPAAIIGPKATAEVLQVIKGAVLSQASRRITA